MKFAAFPRSIKTILEAERKYIIPRYQREYSWEKEQLEEFWDDITKQIKFNYDNYQPSEYFIGSLVLIGDDELGTEFYVVDGQQRLTTITILLSVLTQIGKELGEVAFAKSCYRYIEGKNTEFQEFFKLINETPKPFFQNTIQNFDKEDDEPYSEEEKGLMNAYTYFYKNISSEKKEYKENFLLFLKAIRDQLIGCSVIFITVDNENAAQTIFETLNAKGKDLETLDLIKNKVFEVLNKDHPSDFAKDKWKNIKNNINSRTERISLSVFFRHFWIAKYSFATEKRLYKLFQEKIDVTESSYKDFILDLEVFSKNYIKVTSPLDGDWKTHEEKMVLNSLQAIKDFRVIQPRPLIAVVIELYQNKKLRLRELTKFISQLEAFHFIFSAITSSRASGMESLYSKYSRKLSNVDNDAQIPELLRELSRQLKEKLEAEISDAVFEGKFINLKFSNEFTKDKKIIQYIFKLKENMMRSTNELTIDLMTLEHIHSQKENVSWSHNIGNILPLSGELNENCGTKDLINKLPILEKSEFSQVKEFCKEYQNVSIWSEKLTEERAKKLAKELFDFSMNKFKN